MAELIEQASAKLNLDLLVTGRTPDGYHTLDSIVVFADLGDRLRFTPSTGLSLSIEGPFAAGLREEPDNLVPRAARALASAVGRELAARITLEKNLPVASGIGGGSADAAATLRGLVRLFHLDLDEAALSRLGLKLGADVPVCLASRPARLRGIGDRLTPLAGLPALPLVLVNPGVPVSTGAVFAALQLNPKREMPPPLPERPSLAAFAAWLKASRNDLEPPALELAPVVGRVLEALGFMPGCLLARMSGSGATCFGLFADPASAATAAARIAVAEPGWWCRACAVPGAFR